MLSPVRVVSFRILRLAFAFRGEGPAWDVETEVLLSDRLSFRSATPRALGERNSIATEKVALAVGSCHSQPMGRGGLVIVSASRWLRCPDDHHETNRNR
jgi:hypothetical protein